jgi:hypothetical protein
MNDQKNRPCMSDTARNTLLTGIHSIRSRLCRHTRSDWLLPFSLIMQFAVSIKSYFLHTGPLWRLPVEFFGYFRRASPSGSNAVGSTTKETQRSDDYGKAQIFQVKLSRLSQAEE